MQQDSVCRDTVFSSVYLLIKTIGRGPPKKIVKNLLFVAFIYFFFNVHVPFNQAKALNDAEMSS